MNKNIVVLCDGTWNNPKSRTNIFVLYKELLERDYQQHVVYIDGIGIGESPLNFIIDGAIARNLDTKIKEGYKYIVNHYKPGDDIWLFGFSRGAYTARCIVGMIRNCGILELDRNMTSDQIDKRIDLAYEIYRNRDMIYHPEGNGSDDFKKSFSYPDSEKPIIKFLGLWDTVGAHGIPAYVIGEGFKYLEFYDQVVPSIVDVACQALAIHERTSFFEPCRILPNSSGNERISKATTLWMIENIVQVGGLLMRDDIETYRTRFSPDFGPSWHLKNLMFDRSNTLLPTLMLRDRVISLETDPDQKFLRKDLLYRDGDWLLPFGTRSHLSIQYASDTYEKLRKDMETRGIKLYSNIRYDKETTSLIFGRSLGSDFQHHSININDE
ncbi:hypothetical protein C1646_816375 [Rhizophagus diaphanus]|nr:hypothetical protein C1646_816375 [Rhizophagus diaphanus] [Rhizophagus sp. MUCL 43196]